MAHLGPVAWPPSPLTTERLVLRESEARDRSAVIDLFASPAVCKHLVGVQPRDELERAVSEVPGRRAGYFVVELDGTKVGLMISTRRREPSGAGR